MRSPAAELPVIEVHLSNIFRRESFRQHSYVSLAAKGVICGLGAKGYELALEAMAEIWRLGAAVTAAQAGDRAKAKAEEEGTRAHDGERRSREASSRSSRLIRDLAELLNETGLSEIEIEKSGLKIRVARTLTVAAARCRRRHAAHAPAGRGRLPRRRRRRAGDPAKHPGAVKSPMVGTAYRSPEPRRRRSSRSAAACSRARRC